MNGVDISAVGATVGFIGVVGIMAVQAAFGFALVYFAARLAIRHERKRAH